MTANAICHHVFSAMHTRFSVVLPGMDQQIAQLLSREVESLVVALDCLMNRFEEQSPLADLNRRAGFEPVRPPDELWSILQTCREHWRRSRGVFDVSQAARSDWRQRTAGITPPLALEQKYIDRMCGFEKVVFNETDQTVRFKTPGLKLDLGGIGKGIALDQAADLLRRRGASRALLSFGESSIAVIGAHPSGKPWPLGVADLFEPGKSWHRFDLVDAAMSTSGNRDPQGHIINPRDGAFVAGHRTLSVSCTSAADAEVLSKSLLLTPPHERPELLNEYPSSQAVEVSYQKHQDRFVGKIEWLYESTNRQFAANAG